MITWRTLVSGKPTAFPGFDHAPVFDHDYMPDNVVARLAEIFGGTTTAAAKPDVSNPPGSVVSLPDQALAGVDHSKPHVHISDWFI
jgi:hypothetical protein